MESGSVLNILKLVFAGSPPPAVLTIIAQLVESQSQGALCTLWLADDEGKQLLCAAAPSLPGFTACVGPTVIGPKGASCGTAVYRREPVYVADILVDSLWDDYRDSVSRYGIRSVWSRPLFTREGRLLGTFAILHREVRTPAAAELELIESASHIAGIAIEHYLRGQELRHERDRLRLLLEITDSMTSKLDLSGLVDVLSTNLLGRNAMRFLRPAFAGWGSRAIETNDPVQPRVAGGDLRWGEDTAPRVWGHRWRRAFHPGPHR